MLNTKLMLRGAIIGFGNMGQKVAERVREITWYDAQIIAVCEPSKENRQIARHRFGLRATDNTEELFKLNFDFVVISSTSAAHAEQAKLAAKAGCDIFCEKPIALTLEAADEMIEAAEAAGVITVVNYISRFNEAYIAIKNLIDNGTVGRVLGATHTRIRGYGLHAAGARHPAVIVPEKSGGWAVHHACHDIDLLYWLCGPIHKVYGVTQSTVPDAEEPDTSNSEELVSAIMHFERGGYGVIEDSVCGIRDHYTRIIGTDASIVLHGENDRSELRLRREGNDTDELLSQQDRKTPGGGLDHFFECIHSRQKSSASLRSARHSLQVALAIQESARRGDLVSV